MRFVWKVIFFIYNLFLIALGGAVTMLALGYRDYFSQFAALTQFSTQNRMAALTIGLALILLALIMIMLMFYQRKKKILTVTTEKGNKITVSMKAAQNMVLQSLLGVPGIREVTPEIQSGRKGISVCLHVTVEARQNVPTLCEEMQKRVKDHLIYVSGIQVTDVTLLVENVVPAGRTRSSLSAAKKDSQDMASNQVKKPAESKKSFFSSKKKTGKEEKKVAAVPDQKVPAAAKAEPEKEKVEVKTVNTVTEVKKAETLPQVQTPEVKK